MNKAIKLGRLVFILASILWTSGVHSQSSQLFASDAPLTINLTGDFKSIFRDRHDDAEYRDCQISVEGESETYGLKIKTRGHFRLTMGNCEFPPLQLNFSSKKTPEHSIFAGQDKLKLVLPCRGTQDMIEEYLIYKMYQEVSDFAFQVRLVNINFIDHLGTIAENVTGFILEDDDLMASRLDAEIFKRDGLRGNKMHRDSYLTMAVFQYFIGNTDWSIEFRHNIKLLRKEGINLPVPVPYDFDHAGFVDAPYARPSEALQLSSVTKRRYRGFCLDKLDELNPIFEKFTTKKTTLLGLIDQADLGATNRLRLKAYLSQFYRNITDGKIVKRDFGYPCWKNGTGNVIIKGLK